MRDHTTHHDQDRTHGAVTRSFAVSVSVHGSRDGKRIDWQEALRFHPLAR